MRALGREVQATEQFLPAGLGRLMQGRDGRRIGLGAIGFDSLVEPLVVGAKRSRSMVKKASRPGLSSPCQASRTACASAIPEASPRPESRSSQSLSIGRERLPRKR